MNEQQPSEDGQESTAAAGAQPAPSPPPRQPIPPDRKAQAFWGGMLAGMGIALGLAFVMHVIQQASTNYGMNLDGSLTLLLLLAGPIIGLGLGIGLAAAVPEKTANSAVPHHAAPTDQPPVPSV
ncbi:MAG: hypothetical protein ACLQFR_16570 [Streptosporangiaceae bacterium]